MERDGRRAEVRGGGGRGERGREGERQREGETDRHREWRGGRWGGERETETERDTDTQRVMLTGRDINSAGFGSRLAYTPDNYGEP